MRMAMVGLGTMGNMAHRLRRGNIEESPVAQMLTLVAMEPPASLDSESLRDEKVEVLRSIRLSEVFASARMISVPLMIDSIVPHRPERNAS
jgi:hypothetical protein